MHPGYKKSTRPESRAGIASQPRLQANTSAASSPVIKTANQNLYRLRHHGRAPVRSAEHRRKARGSRRGLFEQSPQGFASSAAAATFEKRREPAAAGGGRVSRVAFSLDTLLLAKQKKVSRPRDELPLKITAHQRTKPQSSQSKALQPPLPNPSPARGEGLTTSSLSDLTLPS